MLGLYRLIWFSLYPWKCFCYWDNPDIYNMDTSHEICSLFVYFLLVMTQPLIFDPCDSFAHDLLDCFTDAGAIKWLPRRQWCNPDGSWWRRQMETFSTLLALCAGNSPVNGEFPHKGQWRGALMVSLIFAWINGWQNIPKAGDLRHHRAHYDVTVMY